MLATLERGGQRTREKELSFHNFNYCFELVFLQRGLTTNCTTPESSHAQVLARDKQTICSKLFTLITSKPNVDINKAQHENYKLDRELVDDLLETMQIGSLCALGGGLPLPIKNALHYFNEELKEYFN